MTKLIDKCVGNSLILRKFALDRNFRIAHEKLVHAVRDRRGVSKVWRILRTKTLPCRLATAANFSDRLTLVRVKP